MNPQGKARCVPEWLLLRARLREHSSGFRNTICVYVTSLQVQGDRVGRGKHYKVFIVKL